MKNSVEKFHEVLEKFQVEFITTVPDSILAPLIKYVLDKNKIKVIQATHESDCVGISTGLNLTNIRSIVLMENSGLRNACETISRFHLSHALYNIYIITHRGGFGEPNWWGQAHDTTMIPLLKMMRFRYKFVNYIEDFEQVLQEAVLDFEARQSSVLIVLNSKFFSN